MDLICDDFDADDAVTLVLSALNGEFDAFEAIHFQDIPTPFRHWLQKQGGLKISQRSIQSLEDLQTVHDLLCRKPEAHKSSTSHKPINLVLRIATRYFKQIYRLKWASSKIRSLTAPGKAPMPRKCGSCGQRLLDDPFPRFKKIDTRRYIARYLKNGCGRQNCSPQSHSVYAIPFDSEIVWSPQDANVLSRPNHAAKWRDHFVRKQNDAQAHPQIVACICRPCKNQGMSAQAREDKRPEWTVETSPRYITKSFRCRRCEKSTKWIPRDEALDWIDKAQLTKSWRTFVQLNGSLKTLHEHPDWFFPKRSG